MKTLPKEHIAWIDLLRVLACFLVVVAHCCDPFVGQLGNNYTEFLTGATVGSLMRCSVPLFVMMSGVLLLPIKMDMPTFYSKRAKRLLTPFIFWSLVLPVLYFLYINSGIETVSPHIKLEDYTLGATITKMYTFLFNFNYDTTPLWYVYMLIGLYLFMPIISAWLKQASKKDIQLFLGIWIISLCLPYVELIAPFLGYTGGALLGVCDWNAYGMFYYFSGFLGYIVLAYYLVNHPNKWNLKQTLSRAIPLFLLGFTITIGGFLLTQKYFPGDYPKLEIFWYFCGFNVFLMTYSVFIVVQKIDFKASTLLNKMAGLTYGIFLCHFVFVQVAYDFIYPYIPLPAIFQLLLMAVASFGISLLITWLMSLNKITKKVVM